MYLKRLIFLTLSLIIFANLAVSKVSKPKLKIALTKTDYETDENYVLMNITIHNTTTSETLIDVDADLLQDLGTNLYIHSIIRTKMGDSDWASIANTGQINLCNFFKNQGKEPFLKLLFANFREYGNLMGACPVEKGHYYLKGFKLNSASVPSFTPAGAYTVMMQLTQKVKNEFKLVYKVTWYAKVTKL